MPKNIVIFSDGTGQRGGGAFDEVRTNIYKLFRATRCGPDSSVDPNLQLTYYDPGLGSVPEGTSLFGSIYRKIHNFISQATGLGITTNIIDCYQEIIRIWEPEDRIFVFGFSRGAYTVRCLAAVLCQCGVPVQMRDGTPLKRDNQSLRRIAREAVTDVYQHVSSPKDIEYLEQRKLLAARFRQRHGSDVNDGSNAYPYFIGVFDTVASIASYPSLVIVFLAALALLFGGSFILSYLTLTFFKWTILLGASSLLFLGLWYLSDHLKFAFGLPGVSFWKTLHRTSVVMRFYDNLLNKNVQYARHAISIDEHRKDFDRVPWGNKEEIWPVRGAGKFLWFKQLWFAGNHADIGGGYPENESRLSDMALSWMIEEAQKIPDSLIIDTNVLKIYPSAKGMQHDETKGIVFKYAKKIHRIPVKDATLHPSVGERFEEKQVLHLDEMKPYRPEGLKGHVELAYYYMPNGNSKIV
jgi:uncharacterized protein (DUF2235 family)